MITVRQDSVQVARVQLTLDVLKEFFASEGIPFEELKPKLLTNRQSTVHAGHKVWLKKIPGTGWFELTGFRTDGSDVQKAIDALNACSNTLSIRAAYRRAHKGKAEAVPL